MTGGVTAFFFKAKGDDFGIGVVGADVEIAGTLKHTEVRDMSTIAGAALAISIKGSNLRVHHLAAHGRVAEIKYKGRFTCLIPIQKFRSRSLTTHSLRSAVQDQNSTSSTSTTQSESCAYFLTTVS